MRRWRVPRAGPGLRCAVLRCAALCGAAALALALPPSRPPAGLAACGAARPHAGCRQRRPAWGGLQGAVNAAGPGPASPTPPPPRPAAGREVAALRREPLPSGRVWVPAGPPPCSQRHGCPTGQRAVAFRAGSSPQ